MTMTYDRPTTTTPQAGLPPGRRWGYVGAVTRAALDAEAAYHRAALELLALGTARAARAFAVGDGGAFDCDAAEFGEEAAIEFAVDRARRTVNAPHCPDGAPCAVLDPVSWAPVTGGHRGPAWTAGGRRLYLRARVDGKTDIWADVPKGRPHGLTEGSGRLPLAGAFALVETRRGWSGDGDARRFVHTVTVVDGAGVAAPAARLAGDDRLRDALQAHGLDPDQGPTWTVCGD